MDAGHRLSRRWIGLLGAVGLALAGTAAAVTLTASPASAATDLALGRTATADSSQSSRPASMANDGNASTRWCASDGATGHWLQVDLGSDTPLASTQVVWEFARAYGYRIAVSTNGTDFTTVADRTGNTVAAQTQTDTFNATGRYVRITITGLPTDVVTWASIFSFSIFGTVPTPGTTTPFPPTPGPTTPYPPTPGPTDPVAGPPPSAAARAACTGTSPIRCTYDVAPGNYDVTVVLGSPDGAGVTEVSGEARRALLAPVTTARGELKRFSFTVSVRSPEGHPTGDRGIGTPGLNLVFAGSAPRLHAIGYVAAPRPVTMFLVGDSTVVDQESAPFSGWGQHLPPHFKLGLSIANYGDSGESSGSGLAKSSLFPAVRSRIRSGDHVFIQMGHNDGRTDKATYQSNLRAMVTQTRAAGGIPVLVTQPVRRHFVGTTNQLGPSGLGVNGLGVDLPAAVRELARNENVPLIDLSAKSERLVESLGQTESKRIFLVAADGIARDDNTHFSTHGGQQMARLVVEGIREAGITGITKFLR